MQARDGRLTHFPQELWLHVATCDLLPVRKSVWSVRTQIQAAHLYLPRVCVDGNMLESQVKVAGTLGGGIIRTHAWPKTCDMWHLLLTFWESPREPEKHSFIWQAACTYVLRTMSYWPWRNRAQNRPDKHSVGSPSGHLTLLAKANGAHRLGNFAHPAVDIGLITGLDGPQLVVHALQYIWPGMQCCWSWPSPKHEIKRGPVMHGKML